MIEKIIEKLISFYFLCIIFISEILILPLELILLFVYKKQVTIKIETINIKDGNKDLKDD